MADKPVDIYGEEAANYNDIEVKNQFPAEQPPEKQPASNPEGQTTPFRVDYKMPPADEVWGLNRPNGLLSSYDPFNPDRQLMDSISQELIEASSPPILYYKLTVQNQNVDKLYGESEQRYLDTPVLIFGSYTDPSPIQELQKFGLNEPETIDIFFNLNYLLNKIGDIIKVGSVLQTYDGRLWEVMTSLKLDEPLWRTIHNNVKAVRLQTEGIVLPNYGNISVSPNYGK